MGKIDCIKIETHLNYKPIFVGIEQIPTKKSGKFMAMIYTQHRVLYTWDDLIMSISQVGKPLHELASTQILFELMKRLTYMENTHNEFIPSIQNLVLSIS